MKIIKRSGVEVVFDINKVTEAIRKANEDAIEKERLTEEQIQEVIVATNPTIEGDTTALYLNKVIKEQTDIKVTRLATGIPVGGDLEYIDKRTLSLSFRGRNTF